MGRTSLRRVGLAALVAALIVAAGALWAGSLVVAPAPRAVGDPPPDLPAESVAIPSGSGSTLAGWFVPHADSKGVVVILHPIRGSRLAMLGRARLFHGAGYSVLLFDFQAHGESSGERVTGGLLESRDARAAVDFARATRPGEPIAVVGVSLGGAAALLASPLGVDAMILEAVYPTIEEAVRNRIRMRLGPLEAIATPLLLVQLEPRWGISATQLRPIDHVGDVGCPLLLLAGELDEHTTLAETERLFEAAREPKALEVFLGAAHVDFQAHFPERYRQRTLAFLDRHIPGE